MERMSDRFGRDHLKPGIHRKVCNPRDPGSGDEQDVEVLSGGFEKGQREKSRRGRLKYQPAELGG